MKLEIKHLAPYLPYGLELKEGKLSAISHRWGTIKYVDSGNDDYNTSIERVTPLLRPLSDLTKEIEHNGERFVPKDKLSASIFTFADVQSMIKLGWILYSDTEKLFEWHFDVFGLIDSGLAIDLNTIQNND